MSDYGDFNLGPEWDFVFDENEYDEGFVASNTSDPNKEAKDSRTDQTNPTVESTSRFKTLTEEDLKALQDCQQSAATRKNTKWGIKLFQEWSIHMNGVVTDFETVTPEDLNRMLRRFFAEAQPKNCDKRAQNMPEKQAQEYHRNSLINVRSAINRHLRDLNRDMDIVRDKCFREANSCLNGKLKFNVKEGISRPTHHKQIIGPEDLNKISSYLHSDNSPVILRYRVWYDLAMHFTTRGLEFHKQLNTNSFEFHTDENMREYVVLTHVTKQKNHQGGLGNIQSPADKRMYSTGSDRCPVESLKLLLKKTDPNASSLFNHCSKAAMGSPKTESIWYTVKSVKDYQFSRFMPDISRNSRCSISYTAHSIRATAIQAMSDAGCELRHIMYMSGHRNESSVRSYNRDCSTSQKERMSDILSSVAQQVKVSVAHPSQTGPSSSLVHSVPHTSAFPSVATSPSVPSLAPAFPHPFPISNQLTSSNFSTSGFISNSAFNNCVFQFSHQ